MPISPGARGNGWPCGWTVVGVPDFNRDSQPDYLLFNAGTSYTPLIWYLNNNAISPGSPDELCPVAGQLRPSRGFQLRHTHRITRSSTPAHATPRFGI